MPKHDFKYGYIYRSPAGKLYKYLGSTCSSSSKRNYFHLTFMQIKPQPKAGSNYYTNLKSFDMFNSNSECFGWTFDKTATLLYIQKEKDYFVNE